MILTGKPSVSVIFVGCEPLLGRQPSSIVLGVDGVAKVSFKLIVLQRRPPESEDDRLLLDGKDGRLGFLGPVGSSVTVWRCKPKRRIGCNVPLGDSLLVGPIALDETIFYCSTDRLRHGGAVVQNIHRNRLDLGVIRSTWA